MDQLLEFERGMTQIIGMAVIVAMVVCLDIVAFIVVASLVEWVFNRIFTRKRIDVKELIKDNIAAVIEMPMFAALILIITCGVWIRGIAFFLNMFHLI